MQKLKFVTLVLSILTVGVVSAAQCSSHSTRYECLLDGACTWNQSTFTCSSDGSTWCSHFLSPDNCQSYQQCSWDTQTNRCYSLSGG